MKKLIITGLIMFLSVSASYAQVNEKVEVRNEKSVFRFNARSDMFTLKGNEAELRRLYDFVERHKPEITSGQMPVHVDGYCTSFDYWRDNLRVAAVRSNRVKSELITHKGLKEEHFTTANHVESYEGMKDAVVVSFTVETGRAPSPKPEQPQPEMPPAVTEQQSQPAPSNTLPQPVDEQPQTVEQPAAPSLSGRAGGGASIRTNLLLWATATPNFGVEWKPSSRIGILVNGAYSHWIWKGDDKHHRTWLLQPEIRYYLGENKKWFVGLEAHAAQFNFKFNDTGYQGDATGGGLTGGYRIALSKCFDMDFSLGLGYTNLKYDTYYRSNEVMVKKESNLKKNVFAPTQLGVSLIWKLK